MKLFWKIILAVALTVVLASFVTLIAVKILDWEKDALADAVREGSTGSFINLSGGTTEYELAGPESGAVVVLAAGMSVPFYIYDGTFEALVSAGFRTLRYNYYGRGFSDRPYVRYTSAVYSRQLSELVDSLHLSRPFNLIGLSMGGLVTANYINEYAADVKRVVLIDPVNRSYPAPSIPEWLMHIIFVFSQQQATADSQLSDFVKPEDFPEWVDRYKVQMQYRGFRHSRISTLYHFAPEDHQPKFRRIKELGIPTLLIWGEHDVTVPFAESSRVSEMTGATFYPVANAAHLPNLEQPALVNSTIVDFLLHPDTTWEEPTTERVPN